MDSFNAYSRFSDLATFQKWIEKKIEFLDKLPAEYRDDLLDLLEFSTTASSALNLQLWKLASAPRRTDRERLERSKIVTTLSETFLLDKESVPASQSTHPETRMSIVDNVPKPKVNKDNLGCSHDKSFCIHTISARGCDLGDSCRFCHEAHPEPEQTQLMTKAREEYAKRGNQNKTSPARIIPYEPPVETKKVSIDAYIRELYMEEPESEIKDISVAEYVDYLKTSSHEITAKFAYLLYISDLKTLKDCENDIRKFLFHISRHTTIITANSKVQSDGIAAGIFIFRVAAHREAIAKSEFKILVRQYMAFLETIEINDNGQILKFDKRPCLDRLQRVIFPNDLTFPLMSVTIPEPKVNNFKPKVPYYTDDKSQTPAINIRELHRRKLCVACRHFLRGMCYRGESCNFCHNPEHQCDVERSHN